jgi:hypothetical protein
MIVIPRSMVDRSSLSSEYGYFPCRCKNRIVLVAYTAFGPELCQGYTCGGRPEPCGLDRGQFYNILRGVHLRSKAYLEVHTLNPMLQSCCVDKIHIIKYHGL